MVICKILEPLGFDDQKRIDSLAKENIFIEKEDTRHFSDEQLIQFIGDAEALLLANRPLNQKVLDACPHLKFISVAFTGLDHIHLPTCEKKNILVKNAAGYATHAVAELTLCMALLLYRKIFIAQAHLSLPTKTGVHVGQELHGKHVGIVGGGAIGSEVARLFTSLGSSVEIYQRSRPTPSLEQLLTQSDIVSLHLPLNEETRHLINRKNLALMKPSAILINTARGPIIDEKALIEALNQEKLAGAALDVFDQDPPLPVDSPLLSAKNVVALPHLGFQTKEALEERSAICFKNLTAWLSQR